eukprot:3631725-Pyramimonas_sp.AAC.1
MRVHRLCGQGEWQSAQGEIYVGTFVDDVFEVETPQDVRFASRLLTECANMQGTDDIRTQAATRSLGPSSR